MTQSEYSSETEKKTGISQSAPAELRRLLGKDLARQLGVYPIPPGMRISVIVPAFNEQDTIGHVLERIRAVDLPTEIIVVDDGSTDATAKILSKLQHTENLKVLQHKHNRGKGAALQTGFAQAKGDIVIIQDADLEYDPSQYRRLIQPIIEGKADVVYGSRFLTTGPHRVLYYWHRVGNWLLTTLSNLFTDLNLTDMETCYKVFRHEVIEAIGPTLKEKRFGIEPEITAKVARRKYRIYEVGIDYFGRTYEEGKKIGFRDALRALWCILRYWRWD